MNEQVIYRSLAEYADGAVKRCRGHGRVYSGSDFAGYATWEQALNMARSGWHDELDTALELAESAVALAEREHMTDTFQPVWDVSGAEVDVARYLSGEPECMIDFPLSKTSKSGRVIALCASVIYSSTLSEESVKRRGRLIAALAMALSRLGHSTELWADVSTTYRSTDSRIRVLVKGVDDEIDPAAIMFAYAHPAMLRILGFAVADGFRRYTM